MLNEAEALIRLQDVQGQINCLRAERNELIRQLHGKVGVRTLARFLGMSPAQVSRVQRGLQGR